VHDEGYVFEVQCQKQVFEIVYMGFEPVLEVLGFVGESAAEVVRYYHPVARTQLRYHLSEKEGPCRISVQHYDRGARAFIEIMIFMAFYIKVI